MNNPNGNLDKLPEIGERFWVEMVCTQHHHSRQGNTEILAEVAYGVAPEIWLGADELGLTKEKLLADKIELTEAKLKQLKEELDSIRAKE